MPKLVSDLSLPQSGSSSLHAVTKSQIDAALALRSKGVIAYDIQTTASATTTSSTPAEITGFNLTATLDSSRRYALYFTGLVRLSVGTATQIAITLYQEAGVTDTVLRDTGRNYCALNSSTYSAAMRHYINAPSSGSTTFYVAVSRSAGTGTGQQTASATAPNILVLEDVGPAI